MAHPLDYASPGTDPTLGERIRNRFALALHHLRKWWAVYLLTAIALVTLMPRVVRPTVTEHWKRHVRVWSNPQRQFESPNGDNTFWITLSLGCNRLSLGDTVSAQMVHAKCGGAQWIPDQSCRPGVAFERRSIGGSVPWDAVPIAHVKGAPGSVKQVIYTADVTVKPHSALDFLLGSQIRFTQDYAVTVTLPPGMVIVGDPSLSPTSVPAPTSQPARK